MPASETADKQPDQAATRQCGRCRVAFPDDPTLHSVAQAEWWLCDPCRATLLGTPRQATHS
jgi:hypothetical protein